MQHKRSDLASSPVVDRFLESTAEEDASLHKALAALDAHGRGELGGILGRFDRRSAGELGPTERLYARRILGKLKKPERDSLALVNRVLDYLDLNANATLEEDELELCVEVLELFASADSVNDTLTEKELRMLYAVLRHLDADSSGRFERHERQALRAGLSHPRDFLEQQRATNPLLQKVLSGETI
jgi:hypothetical protein